MHVICYSLKRKATKMTKRESIVLSKPQSALGNVERSSYEHGINENCNHRTYHIWQVACRAFNIYPLIYKCINILYIMYI